MLILSGLALSSPVFASDATIFLSPITGMYTTGTTFTLAVVVGSGGEAVNAIEGRLEYNPKEIEVISIDKANSVLTSWTVDPVFTNDTGELSFGGLLSTSTVLARGEVLKFTVRALRSGELHIRFASGAAVHAADGTGGNILTQLNGGVYVTAPKENEPIAEPTPSTVSPVDVPVPSGEVLGAATGTAITSTSHPDPEGWYATSTAILDWGIPADTKTILLAFDKRKEGVGTNPYPPTIHEKIITDIKDGVWYFHLTKELNNGERETSSYRIAIDTALPSLVSVSESPRKDLSDPSVGILLSASDTLSGVDHYEFSLDDGKVSTWSDDGSHTRVLSGIAVGAHELAVAVVDKAGNRAAGHLSFTVENLPTPVLSVLNTAFIEGDKLRLTLTSVSKASLEIGIARANTSPATEEFTVDDKGYGVFESALPLTPGSYTVSVVAHTASGAVSLPSSSASFEVNSSFFGVMKRHPMIPVAGVGLTLLLVGSFLYWKRFMGSEELGDEIYEDEEDQEEDVEQEINYAPVKAEPVKNRPAISSGAVVLGKKEKVQMPATRL